MGGATRASLSITPTPTRNAPSWESAAGGKLHGAMANLGYQLDHIWNHERHKLLGAIVRGFPRESI